MYKVSIWLKGGGKIVAVCDVDEKEISHIHFSLVNSDTGVTTIRRSFSDKFPIKVQNSEVAAVEVAEKYDASTDNHTAYRKLETRY